MVAITAPSAPLRLSLSGSRRAQDCRWRKDEERQFGYFFLSLQIPDVDVDVEALMDACMSGSEVMTGL